MYITNHKSLHDRSNLVERSYMMSPYFVPRVFFFRLGLSNMVRIMLITLQNTVIKFPLLFVVQVLNSYSLQTSNPPPPIEENAIICIRYVI